MLAPLENHFSPFRTQWSPSRTAVVCMPVASAPAAFSVIEKQIRMSPATSGSRYLRFCSSVPCSMSVNIVASCGPMQFSAQAASMEKERPTSICTMAFARCPRPMPPHSTGTNGHHRPSALALLWSSPTISK